MRGDGRNQLQISAPLPLKNIFRMIPLSTQSISLDSPLNIYNLFEKEKTTLKVCTIEKIAVVEKRTSGSAASALRKNSGSGIADQR
jgi:hypothetical protein